MDQLITPSHTLLDQWRLVAAWFQKTPRMPCQSRAGHVILILFALSLWGECVLSGSSFLSPTQKPQGRDRKPLRVGRRAAAELGAPIPLEDNRFMMSAPFQLGVSLSEGEYEEYGPVLQKILLEVLGDMPPLE